MGLVTQCLDRIRFRPAHMDDWHELAATTTSCSELVRCTSPRDAASALIVRFSDRASEAVCSREKDRYPPPVLPL